MTNRKFEDLDMLILEWAREKGILKAKNPNAQMLKCVSEVGELADAVVSGNMHEIVDGIGDVVVTLIILAELHNLDLTDCLEEAYEVIAKRNGSMIGGVFVKDGKS